jgi:hypothetical protein
MRRMLCGATLLSAIALTVASAPGAGVPSASAGPPIRAGSIVTASVRIVLDGRLVRPTRVTCAGTIDGTKVRGVPKATRGKAACTYKTSRAARGKTLRGSVAFTARGKRYVRHFAAKLR